MTELEFYQLANKFLSDLFHDMAKNVLVLSSHWDIDHICFRSDSNETYETLKKSFLTFSDLLVESEVNGRIISTFKLNKPLFLSGWRIDLVELPAPKKNKITLQGFEHIEIVCDLPFEELKKKYGHLNIEEKGLLKSFNQELEICFGERNLKFHHCSLESVINIEKNLPVWKALQESKILELFKSNNPLVAGTFPLGLESQDSDLDIVMGSDDLKRIEKDLEHHFSHCESFHTIHQFVDGLDTLICNFVFNTIPFEVFVQDRNSVKQTAYRHYLIEERLLKLGGASFKEEILRERVLGIKTEPAFAKVLKLNGDAYSELLDLQLKTNIELGELF